ncbi:2-iminoacetate synthase ThiH [Chitinophaga caseinilytica]|uniref:2-iminoacetate synthase ThiH n=1 Tax=Chitinophaga caseinilytica TaxID=2267521 RepID=UPI003C2BE3FB
MQTHSFENIFRQYDWDTVKNAIYAKTPADVENALNRPRRGLDDFMALVSPAAAPYLERMAALSMQLTQQRFGKTIQLYAPVYLSNECQNICTYCGFSLNNPLRRKTLTGAEMLREIDVVKAMGFGHVLLVTGEAWQTVGMEYFSRALPVFKQHFPQLSIEVQPMEEEDYRALKPLGLHSVLVYQETYHEEDYKKHHPKGRKSSFGWRLETPDRLGRAGIHKIGLGVLIGLEDWRTDSFFTALHLDYLQRTYWQTRYSISFPRLRPFSGGLPPKSIMSDRQLLQLICAYRLFNPDVELSLSTRESPRFRDHLVPLGITTMSAGSKTNPGGYAVAPSSLEQFEISDERSPAVVADMIRSHGYSPVWKDWDDFGA